MLRQRIISAIVCLPLVIILIWLGSFPFSIFIAIIALGATLEFYKLKDNFNKNYSLLYLGILFSLILLLRPHYQNTAMFPELITIMMVVSLIILLHQHSKLENVFTNWAWMIAGGFYIGWMLSYWIDLRILTDGRTWVYFAMLITFANDSGAYFVGKRWGKNKLAITISPHKTWEGAIGGLLSAIIGATVIYIVLAWIAPMTLDYWQVIPLACLISLFAQLGDLVESLLKRSTGVKESGRFLPGHGGILDRFDSLIFVGVMVYYYAIWIVL
jgi:phosphatidate cytidylyltransferase